MTKVSIGMLGWRFDEDDILDDDGEFLPLNEMPDDARKRITRLDSILNAPCNACWLIHGDENVEECNTAKYVYGEPMSEILLCEEHEPDFVYWFREDGGREYMGNAAAEDAFYQWFLDGGRAPTGYEGMEYVDTDPDNLPKPPKPTPEQADGLTGDGVADRVGLSEEDLADSDVDLGAEYPGSE